MKSLLCCDTLFPILLGRGCPCPWFKIISPCQAEHQRNPFSGTSTGVCWKKLKNKKQKNTTVLILARFCIAGRLRNGPLLNMQLPVLLSGLTQRLEPLRVRREWRRRMAYVSSRGKHLVSKQEWGALSKNVRFCTQGTQWGLGTKLFGAKSSQIFLFQNFRVSFLPKQRPHLT